MNQFDTFTIVLLLAVQITVLALGLGLLAWWLYRRASREAALLRDEKRHLQGRRDAHLRFLLDRLSTLQFRRAKNRGTESRLEHLERRILEEDKRHTEAAKAKDTDIWDLRTASTKSLIDVVRAIDPHALADRSLPGKAQGGGQVDDQLQKQNEELKTLRPYREAWIRLQRYARRESEENAKLREALQQIDTDTDTAAAVRELLQDHSSHQTMLDDYLGTTDSLYEGAAPEQLRRARRYQQRVTRTQRMVDAASSRIDAMSERMPEVLREQTRTIADLEKKLDLARQGQALIKQNYSKEIKSLQNSNREAEENLRGLDRENRRLRHRVRNLLELTRAHTMLPPPASGNERHAASNGDPAATEAKIERLHQALRQEQSRRAELEKKVEKYKALESVLESTLRADPAEAPEPEPRADRQEP